jgi:uncharacterized protein (TIGR03089 family)
VNTSGAAFDSFNAAVEHQTGRYGDKPFLTWYDDGRDERVELSYRTFENWTAKTANLVVDELGAGPGDRVGVLLPDHWRTPVVLAGCWRAGARVVVLDPAKPDPGPGGLVAAFVGEDDLATAGDALGGTALVAVTAALLGRPGADLGRALDYARVVPGMGDLFDAGPDPAGDALVAGDQAATMAGLLERAAGLAARTGLTDADRLLSGRPLGTVDGAVTGLLAPLAAGAGVVLVGGLDPARFWKRVADEKVAVAALGPGQAAAVLDAGPPPPGLDRSRLRLVAGAGATEALAAGFRARFDVPLLDDD